MESDRKARTPSAVRIRRAANGGHIVTHEYDNSGAGESYMPPREHAFTSHKAMMAHVHKATGGKLDADGDRDARPAGVSGRPKAAPPTARTRGAGVD